MIDCTFYGSYYDPYPWTEQACVVESYVPEGCPIHFTTAAGVMAADVTVNGSAGGATLVDTQDVALATIDVYSCDCPHVTEETVFQRFAVATTGLHAGDYATIGWPSASGPQMGAAITAAGPCPAVEWPSEYGTAIACDRCPVDPAGSGSGSGSGGGSSHGGGCNAGGAPGYSVAVLALLARRRRMLRA